MSLRLTKELSPVRLRLARKPVPMASFRRAVEQAILEHEHEREAIASRIAIDLERATKARRPLSEEAAVVDQEVARTLVLELTHHGARASPPRLFMSSSPPNI